MDETLDPTLEWIRIDVGYQDSASLDILLRFVSKYSSYRPAFIALIGSLSPKAELENRPEIEAILNNTLPCYVLNRRPGDLDYIPSYAVSVYNRRGTEIFYFRVNGRNVDVVENPEKREFLTDTDPPDEVELDLAELDSEYSRLLLFVFTMSHVVLWFQPDLVFSNYDLRLLKVVDLARLKGLSLINKMLAQLTDNKDWVREGCLCCPRLVFVFSGSPVSTDSTLASAGKGFVELRAEQDVSVRLYTVLKKCRLISIPRSSGLCFLSAKKETVIFAPEKPYPSMFLDVWPRAKDFESKIAEREPEFFLPLTGKSGKEKATVNPLRTEERTVANTFDKMLKSCINDIMHSNSTSQAARPAGFPWPSHLYKPSLSEWFAAAIHFHSLLFNSEEYRSLLDTKLGCTMSISRKYSRSVAAFSINSFTLRIPESSSRQIRNCLHSYMQFARGPAAKGFGTALTFYLSTGAFYRRQCAFRSLYGSRCALAVHATPQQHARCARGSRKHQLPVMFHQSRISLTSFCSCGKTVQQRAEPFNITEANELFYESMDYKCCSLLEKRVDFPSLTVNRKDKKPKEEKKPEMVTIKRYDSFPELSTAVQLNEKEINQPYISLPVPLPDESVKRVPSLKPYMFQVGMDYDMVPRISSWVLYGLGPAGRYQHTHGLEHHLQADFLNLHHYLLPLGAEVILARKHRILKQHIPNRPTQQQTVEAGSAWHAKMYFGLDYECPKGHRFMYKSKEVFELKNDGKHDVAQGIVDDILVHGAPLFVPCPCKSIKDNRQFIAQLMRIHVVTPRDPMQVGLLPRVRVGRATPAFTPGVENPVVLEGNVYWVLRMPFCYYDSVANKGPVCAPRISYP